MNHQYSRSLKTPDTRSALLVNKVAGQQHRETGRGAKRATPHDDPETGRTKCRPRRKCRSGTLPHRLQNGHALHMMRHRKDVGLSGSRKRPGQSRFIGSSSCVRTPRASNERHGLQSIPLLGRNRPPRPDTLYQPDPAHCGRTLAPHDNRSMRRVRPEALPVMAAISRLRVPARGGSAERGGAPTPDSGSPRSDKALRMLKATTVPPGFLRLSGEDDVVTMRRGAIRATAAVVEDARRHTVRRRALSIGFDLPTARALSAKMASPRSPRTERLRPGHCRTGRPPPLDRFTVY